MYQEIKIIVIKVHLHCENCEQDLKILLLKHKGKEFLEWVSSEGISEIDFFDALLL